MNAQTATLRLSPTDPVLEREGVWKTYCGVELKIARRNQPAFVEAMTPPEDGEETPEQRRDRTIRAMAEHILVDWRGWKVPDEEAAYGPDDDPDEPIMRDVEYSVENAVNLLTHDYDAREFVSRTSMQQEHYIRERAEATAGNS